MKKIFKFNLNNKNGFTLIETIIYTGLLGLIIGAMLPTVFELLQGGAKLNAKTVIQSEANFVLRKINLAFSGASNVVIINSNFLRISRYDGVQVDFCLDSSNPLKKAIKIRRGVFGASLCSDSSFLPITTQNVFVNDLLFVQVGVDPIGIKSSIDISGHDFEITKYVRK